MVAFNFIQILIEHSVKNSGEPDQTPHSVASGLGLHCVAMSHKKDARPNSSSIGTLFKIRLKIDELLK